MVLLTPKTTGMLAWLGLAVVVAVPSADFLTGNGQRAASSQPLVEAAPVVDATPARVAIPVLANPQARVEAPRVVLPAHGGQPAATDQMQTASIAGSGDPVKDYLASGKPLPSYIGGDAPAAAAAKPIPIIPSAAPVGAASAPAPAKTEVASVSPEQVIPYPRPLSMRPRLADFPNATPRPVQQPMLAAAPVRLADPAPGPQPLIIEEARVQQLQTPRFRVPQVQVNVPRVPVGLAPFPPAYADDEIVTADQLEEWDSGSLAEYLAQRGLLAGREPAPSAGQWRRGPQPARGFGSYDRNGYWFIDGPNAY